MNDIDKVLTALKAETDKLRTPPSSAINMLLETALENNNPVDKFSAFLKILDKTRGLIGRSHVHNLGTVCYRIIIICEAALFYFFTKGLGPNYNQYLTGTEHGKVIEGILNPIDCGFCDWSGGQDRLQGEQRNSCPRCGVKLV